MLWSPKTVEFEQFSIWEILRVDFEIIKIGFWSYRYITVSGHDASSADSGSAVHFALNNPRVGGRLQSEIFLCRDGKIQAAHSLIWS